MPANQNTAEPQKSRRRWFQFRLRTLLLAVTLIGPVGYVGHEAAIVRARRNWLAANVLLEAGSFVDREMLVANKCDPTKSPGALRLWLGDHPTYFIQIRRDAIPPQAELNGIVDLFPEATLTILWR
jgi:hypothetical protein